MINSERLHRTAKLFMDTGEAKSVEEAEAKLREFHLSLAVGSDIASSKPLQAALLTAVNTGRRCFLGGVSVSGNLDVDLLVPWRGFRKLSDAVADLHGNISMAMQEGAPQIFIGDVRDTTRRSRFAVQATFDRWAGGVIPCDDRIRLAERGDFTPAGVLAGALAVSEAFQHVRGSVKAGRRDVGLSLWQPFAAEWKEGGDLGPDIEYLPAKLWLIGLGHLGQAYLWTLGLLPYASPDEVLLYLQDHDVLSDANDSTSPLTFPGAMKMKKTRVMATWCEQRGFKTVIVERRFNESLRLADNEPRVALCGVDNPTARAALEDVGFQLILEAGLGKEANEYLAFQVHTFPGPQQARDRWKDEGDSGAMELLATQPAYTDLATKGLDKCGITTLAGRSVGASFVGTTVSTLVISELLRLIHGGGTSALLDGSLALLDNSKAIPNHVVQPLNPGITKTLQPTGR